MDAERNLPDDIYGHFDVKPTEDGGKEYALPHTVWGTVMGVVMAPALIGALLMVAMVIVLGHRTADLSWWGIIWRVVMVFLGVHGALFLVTLVAVLVSGKRSTTRITIRADGLVLNKLHFFPARHILSISFGTTYNRGKPDELDVPRFEIDFGTRRVLLAQDLDVAASKLFERLFREDTRRYWHRHN